MFVNMNMPTAKEANEITIKKEPEVLLQKKIQDDKRKANELIRFANNIIEAANSGLRYTTPKGDADWFHKETYDLLITLGYKLYLIDGKTPLNNYEQIKSENLIGFMLTW